MPLPYGEIRRHRSSGLEIHSHFVFVKALPETVTVRKLWRDEEVRGLPVQERDVNVAGDGRRKVRDCGVGAEARGGWRGS